jgi:hypothetical protein
MDRWRLRVLAVNRTMREKPASVEHVFSWTELDRMLGECDIVVLSCALTPETTGLIDGRRLAAMKPSAFLINLARGPIAPMGHRRSGARCVTAIFPGVGSQSGADRDPTKASFSYPISNT